MNGSITASIMGLGWIYRDLARMYHPDKAERMGIDKEEAEKKFREIAEAYEVC